MILLCTLPFHRFVKKSQNGTASSSTRLVCKICMKIYSNYPSMYRHINVVHRGIRRKCNLCPKTFADYSGLWQHRRKKHRGSIIGQWKRKIVVNPKEAFKTLFNKIPKINTNNFDSFCEICNIKFFGETNLTKHIELVHYYTNNHCCPYPGCLEKFESESEWKLHFFEKRCKSNQTVCICYF